ncbi:MAG: asparagine synthase-related protein [Candidatus Saganbacteria bacterium]|nr:asparagine synthase-related protein [Candidatus Saganbacteria bacterium]
MKRKAIALLSGGLDSQLVVKLMLGQGIELFALNFYSAFHVPSKAAEKAAEKFGINLKKVDFTDQLLAAVKNPKYGHGSGMNPCVDCRIIEFTYAKNYMKEVGAEFVVSGEVLGSRPMSQRMAPLKAIVADSGLDGYILRPLSAKLLPPTIPEKEGWVDREKLLDIQGRSRQPQMFWAKELNLGEYPSPAGGCLLTEKVFAVRLRDLLERKPDPARRDLDLLSIGRHFFSSEGIRIVIPRREEEDVKLRKMLQRDDLVLELKDYLGPIALLPDKNASRQTLEEAGTLLSRFSKTRDLDKVIIKYAQGEVEVSPSKAPQLELQLSRV